MILLYELQKPAQKQCKQLKGQMLDNVNLCKGRLELKNLIKKGPDLGWGGGEQSNCAFKGC